MTQHADTATNPDAIYNRVLDAALANGLSRPLGIACAALAANNQWRDVRAALIAANAVPAERSMRDAYCDR